MGPTSRKFEKRAEYEGAGSWALAMRIDAATPEELRANKHRLVQDVKLALREFEQAGAQ